MQSLVIMKLWQLWWVMLQNWKTWKKKSTWHRCCFEPEDVFHVFDFFPFFNRSKQPLKLEFNTTEVRQGIKKKEKTQYRIKYFLPQDIENMTVLEPDCVHCVYLLYIDPRYHFCIKYFSWFRLREADFSWELRHIIEIVDVGQSFSQNFPSKQTNKQTMLPKSTWTFLQISLWDCTAHMKTYW